MQISSRFTLAVHILARELASITLEDVMGDARECCFCGG